MAQDDILSDVDEDYSQLTVPVAPFRQSEGSASVLSSVAYAGFGQKSRLASVSVSVSSSSLFRVDSDVEDTNDFTV